jgi:hypothetical protein
LYHKIKSGDGRPGSGCNCFRPPRGRKLEPIFHKIEETFEKRLFSHSRRKRRIFMRKENNKTLKSADGSCPYCGSWKVGPAGGFAARPSSTSKLPEPIKNY